jgi:alpha-glucosidase
MATRLGEERTDLLNIMLQTLPGIAVTYQGEELGLLNTHISWEDTLDPSACNTNDPVNYEKASRDGARTPFPWDDSPFAGFTTGNWTWLPVNSDYQTMNVKVEEAATNSHLKIFKKLTALRQNNVLRQGAYEFNLVNADNVIVYRRWYETSVAIIILNFGSSAETVNVPAAFPSATLPTTLNVYTASLNAFVEGASHTLQSVTVPANKAVVLTNVVL